MCESQNTKQEHGGTLEVGIPPLSATAQMIPGPLGCGQGKVTDASISTFNRQHPPLSFEFLEKQTPITRRCFFCVIGVIVWYVDRPE